MIVYTSVPIFRALKKPSSTEIVPETGEQHGCPFVNTSNDLAVFIRASLAFMLFWRVFMFASIVSVWQSNMSSLWLIWMDCHPVSELLAAAEEVGFHPSPKFVLNFTRNSARMTSECGIRAGIPSYLLQVCDPSSRWHIYLILPRGVLNCIRALGGYTQPQSAETVFDTENFVESEYLAHIQATSGNLSLTLNWFVVLLLVAKMTPISFFQVQFL